jgi:hypothetical protein
MQSFGGYKRLVGVESPSKPIQRHVVEAAGLQCQPVHTAIATLFDRILIKPIRNDPVVEALASLTSRAIEFNKVQGRYQTIPMNGEKLGEMLLAARKRQLEDAKALSDLPLGVDVSVPEAESLYVAVVPGRRLVPMGSTVIWAGVPVEEGAERVTVEFINGANGTHGPVELMQKIFSIGLADPRISAAWGVPNFVLAELLGFGVEEVRLDW